MTSSGRWYLAGLVLGIGIAYPMLFTSMFNFAPVVLAGLLILGVLLGQAVAARPVREPGTASLRARRIRDYVPGRRLGVMVIIAAPIAVPVLVFETPGQPGPYLEYHRTVEPVNLNYVLATAAVVLTLAAISLWAVVRVAASGGDPQQQQADESWRRTTAITIVNSCVALLSLLMAAVLMTYAGEQMDWRAGGYPPIGMVLGVAAAAWLLTFAWHAVALITPPKTGQP